VFDEGFPEIYTPEQLRAPLKYITTNKEFDLLMASDQPKAAVDNFWLSKAGNEERAKSLIQKYYRNVEESNAYFTSYLEGWKTDRGLIYTVLGKPNYVYRSENTEEWIYGEPEHRNSLWFTFVKVKNPFTDRDYMLLRSPTFKDPWNITVQSWRR
jgi:GWxTD domain-containing protein